MVERITVLVYDGAETIATERWKLQLSLCVFCETTERDWHNLRSVRL